MPFRHFLTKIFSTYIISSPIRNILIFNILRQDHLQLRNQNLKSQYFSYLTDLKPTSHSAKMGEMSQNSGKEMTSNLSSIFPSTATILCGRSYILVLLRKVHTYPDLLSVFCFYLDIRLFFWFFRLFPSLDICLHLAFSRGWGRFSKVLWLKKLEILLYLLIFTHSRPCKSSFLLTLEVVKANFYNL